MLSVVHLLVPYEPPERYKEYTHNGEVIIIDTWALPPDTNKVDFFPYSDVKVTPEWYAHYMSRHLVLIVFALFIYKESDKYKTALLWFLLIHIAGLIDFCLTYGFVWFTINGYEIGFNLIKIVIFMLAIAYEYRRESESAGQA